MIGEGLKIVSRCYLRNAACLVLKGLTFRGSSIPHCCRASSILGSAHSRSPASVKVIQPRSNSLSMWGGEEQAVVPIQALGVIALTPGLDVAGDQQGRVGGAGDQHLGLIAACWERQMRSQGVYRPVFEQATDNCG